MRQLVGCLTFLPLPLTHLPSSPLLSSPRLPSPPLPPCRSQTDLRSLLYDRMVESVAQQAALAQKKGPKTVPHEPLPVSVAYRLDSLTQDFMLRFHYPLNPQALGHDSLRSMVHVSHRACKAWCM